MRRSDSVDQPTSAWRAAWIWGVALGATFVIRGVYDLLNPTTDYGLRSQWSTLAGLAVCFGTGLHAAWRSKDWGRGSFVTVVAVVIGFGVAIVGGVIAVLVVDTFRSVNVPGAIAEALDVPLHVMLVLGGLAGSAGAAIAVGLTRLTPLLGNRAPLR